MSKAFRTDTKLSSRAQIVLNLLPFIIGFACYLALAVFVRWLESPDAIQMVHWLETYGIAAPNPRLLPLPTDIWQSFLTAIQPDTNGQIQLLQDVCASLTRFGIGLSIASVIGVPLGLYVGLFPLFRELFRPTLTLLDKVQPLLLLPVLFLFLGVEEAPKIAIVVLGILPGIALEVSRMVEQTPREQLYKAQTLGATESEIAWSIIFPQIFPLVVAAIAACFKAAWGYVIAAESNVASCGIGYRIFLAKRFMDMPTILSYVVLAMLIMFALDLMFQRWRGSYRWANQ